MVQIIFDSFILSRFRVYSFFAIISILHPKIKLTIIILSMVTINSRKKILIWSNICLASINKFNFMFNFVYVFNIYLIEKKDINYYKINTRIDYYLCFYYNFCFYYNSLSIFFKYLLFNNQDWWCYHTHPVHNQWC